jgi:hypothetical protein
MKAIMTGTTSSGISYILHMKALLEYFLHINGKFTIRKSKSSLFCCKVLFCTYMLLVVITIWSVPPLITEFVANSNTTGTTCGALLLTLPEQLSWPVFLLVFVEFMLLTSTFVLIWFYSYILSVCLLIACWHMNIYIQYMIYHVFRFLVSCCHVCYYVRVKNDVWFVLPPISFVGGSSFICIYLEYLGPTSSSFVLTSTVWSTTIYIWKKMRCRFDTFFQRCRNVLVPNCLVCGGFLRFPPTIKLTVKNNCFRKIYE